MKSAIALSLLFVSVFMFFQSPSAGAQSPLDHLTSDPDCIVRNVYSSTPIIDCFFRSIDLPVWHISYSGGFVAGPSAGVWSPLESLGNPPGGLGSGPAAASWGPNRLDVFAAGADHSLWHVYWGGGGWSAWESLGGYLTSDPDCVSRDQNLIDCVVRGGDNAVYLKSFDGNNWGPWWSLGGIATSGPTIASRSPDFLDIFVKNTNYGLSHRVFLPKGALYDWEFVPDSEWMDHGYHDPDCTAPAGAKQQKGEDIIFCAATADAGFSVGLQIYDGTEVLFDRTNGWSAMYLPPVGGPTRGLSGPTVTSWCEYTLTALKDCHDLDSHRNVRVDIFVQGGDLALWHVKFRESQVGGNPGSTGEIWEKVKPGTATTTSIKASVTSATSSASVSTDWAVVSVGIQPSSPVAGTAVKLQMQMVALSTTGGYPQNVNVQCYIDGSACGSGTVAYPGPTGTSFTVSASNPWIAIGGTHSLRWSIDASNDPNAANNVMSIALTVQSAGSQSVSTTSTQPSVTSVTSSTPQSTVVLTQTVTQQPTSTASQAGSQPDILGILQQNGLPLIVVLAAFVVVVGIAMMRRGKRGSLQTATH